MTLPDLEALAQRIQNGDHEAFSELVRQMQQRLFAYCYPMLNNRQEAEDAVQETFLQAYAQIERYCSESFGGWLYTIAQRICFNKLRTRRRQFSLFKRASIFIERTPQPEVEHSLASDEAMRMLADLNNHDRSLLILRIIHDLDYAQIAAIIGGKPATMRKRYERAVRRLRKQLTETQTVWPFPYERRSQS